MNKFDRVVSILILLQSKKIIKAAYISDKFGTSLRTVYRDISTLKKAGIPIIGDPGIGYSIMEGYRLPPIMFDEGEAMALMTAEKFMGKVADQETQNLYRSAMTKIRAILRSREKNSLEVLDHSVSIGSYNNIEHKSYLQDLFKSITNQSILNLTYKKATGEVSERLIEPIGCYHHYNNWYVVAYCQLKEDYRTFRMNRIETLIVLDKQFEQKNMTLQRYLQLQNEAWMQEQSKETIEVLFKNSVVQYANMRKFYFNLVKEEATADGVRMTFLNNSIEFIARWLMQFTNQAEVLAPQALKDRMKDLATELYEHCS